jgi:iron complex outermembrane recepter protein
MLFGNAIIFVFGADYSHLNFVRSRGFPSGDSVDPFNPSPGFWSHHAAAESYALE